MVVACAKGGLTSACKKRLYPYMCISDTEEEKLGVSAKLQVIVPQIAHELLDPSFKCPLGHPWDEWLSVLWGRRVSAGNSKRDLERAPAKLTLS